MIEPSHDIDRTRLYLVHDLERLCEIVVRLNHVIDS